MFGVTSLFIYTSYNIKGKSVCVHVAASEEIDILIDIFMTHTCWPPHELEMIESAFSQMTTMIQILRDFKPILDLDLYGEHMP